MAKCAAIKADGQRCKGEATPGSEWCYSHDPANAVARKRNARKGGKSGGNGRPGGAGDEIVKIKEWLRGLASGVLNEKIEVSKAYAVNALLSTQLRAIELERKIKETDELEKRIVELEQIQRETEAQKEWGQDARRRS
jgi:hypothetical protein